MNRINSTYTSTKSRISSLRVGTLFCVPDQKDNVMMKLERGYMALSDGSQADRDFEVLPLPPEP